MRSAARSRVEHGETCGNGRIANRESQRGAEERSRSSSRRSTPRGRVEEGGDPSSIVCVDSTTSLATRGGRNGHSHSDSCTAGKENECGKDQGEEIPHDGTPQGRFEPPNFEAATLGPVDRREVARGDLSHMSDGAAGQSLLPARRTEPPRFPPRSQNLRCRPASLGAAYCINLRFERLISRWSSRRRGEAAS